MSMFKKAERKRAYLKVAYTGPSGSGKTLSALKTAAGLGDKIAVIDTENGSASLYSGEVDFDVVEIGPPFTTEKYIDAINAAEKAGYEVLVIDSITHAWSGDGGLLQQKEDLDARGGNSFTNWAKITPKDNAFRSEILQSRMHVIVTMRSKQDTILVDRNGRSVPQKVGMAPIQREGIEYEFTTVLDMAMNHQASASKDRTGLFDGKLFTPSRETGEELLAWLNSAPMPDPEPPKAQTPKQESKPVVRQHSPAAKHVAQGTISNQAGDYVVKKGKNGWANKTIKSLVDSLGPDAFFEDVEWLATKSKIKHFEEIKMLKWNADKYAEELAANHEEASMKVGLDLNESFDGDTAFDAAKAAT